VTCKLVKKKNAIMFLHLCLHVGVPKRVLGSRDFYPFPKGSCLVSVGSQAATVICKHISPLLQALGQQSLEIQLKLVRLRDTTK